MFKSPLTTNQIKAIAKEMELDDCFLRGGKSQILYNIINHFDTMRMFSTIIGTPEALENAKKDEGNRNLFIEKAKVTDDGIAFIKGKPKSL
jgi:hypothetical protein